MSEGIRKLIVAIDTPDLDDALAVTSQLRGYVAAFKLGLEFFSANGPQGVRRISCSSGVPVMLDLKLHDIPNTVAGAVRSLSALCPRFLTVHASGGCAMIAAARDAADGFEPRPMILAVTILTSLDTKPGEVLRLAQAAVMAGADGIVCSPLEASDVRSACPEAVIVCPGIRPFTSNDDQKRVATPEYAIAAGANLLVVGRPITQAVDPVAAVEAIFLKGPTP